MISVDNVVPWGFISIGLFLASFILRGIFNVCKNYVLEEEASMPVFKIEKKLLDIDDDGSLPPFFTEFGLFIILDLFVCLCLACLPFLFLQCGIFTMWLILRLLRFVFRIKKKVAKDVKF